MTACDFTQMRSCATLNPASIMPSLNDHSILSELNTYAAFFFARNGLTASSHSRLNARYEASDCRWSFAISLSFDSFENPRFSSTVAVPYGISQQRRSIFSLPMSRFRSSRSRASPYARRCSPKRQTVPGLIEFFDGVMADFFEAVIDDLAEHWLYLSDNGGSVHGITGQQQTSRTSAKIKHFVAWLATPTQGFFVEGDGLHRGVFIENSRHALSEPQLEDVEDVIC